MLDWYREHWAGSLRLLGIDFPEDFDVLFPMFKPETATFTHNLDVEFESFQRFKNHLLERLP